MIAARKIRELKFWVDNRDNTRGSMKKMPPEVYTPLIKEAHTHGMIVHAHATNLQDQKGMVKAGVDVLIHTLVAEKVADIRAGKTWLPSGPCSAPASGQFTQREENLKYNFPRYIAAGARIVLGADAGVSAKYSSGFAEHHELGMYVRLGLTPAEAIVASTSRPTEVLRSKDTGTLAKGKRADFIVLNANPLENIRNTREIDSVYLYGAKLDREALQTKFKQAVVDRDAAQAKAKRDYVPHPSSRRPFE